MKPAPTVSISESVASDEAKPQTASEMGRKGGRATGESKRRGDSAYYRSLRAKRGAKERWWWLCYGGHKDPTPHRRVQRPVAEGEAGSTNWPKCPVCGRVVSMTLSAHRPIYWPAVTVRGEGEEG